MRGKPLLIGLSGYPGTVTCKVRIIHRAEEPGSPDWEKLAQIQPGECLVSGSYGPPQNQYLKKAAGIIADTGGKISHGMIIAGEIHVPAICDTEMQSMKLPGVSSPYATEALKDGQMIVLEGYTKTTQTKKSSGVVKNEEIGTIYEWLPDNGEPPPSPSVPGQSITTAGPKVSEPMSATERAKALMAKYKSQMRRG